VALLHPARPPLAGWVHHSLLLQWCMHLTLTQLLARSQEGQEDGREEGGGIGADLLEMAEDMGSEGTSVELDSLSVDGGGGDGGSQVGTQPNQNGGKVFAKEWWLDEQGCSRLLSRGRGLVVSCSVVPELPVQRIQITLDQADAPASCSPAACQLIYILSVQLHKHHT
jgi:hypothetical protein